METRLLRLTQVLLVVLLVPQFAQALVDTAWVRRYDGPAHGGDAATLIALDSAGNVYVAGGSTGVGTGLDFVVIKYYPNGDTAWVRRRDFGGDDSPSGLAVDAQGNVYVSGTTGNNRIATVKYSSTGQPVWTRMFGTRAQGNGLGLDAEENVAVCGDTLSPPPLASSDVVVLKYLPNGDTAWARFYDWAGYDDAADAMAVTQQGDICIVGWCSDTVPGGNLLAIKWNPAGERPWVTVYDGPQHGAEAARDVAVDRQGNVVITGVADRGYGTPFDYLTVRYSPDGETLWTRRHGTPDGGDEAGSMAVDDSGDVWVTGESEDQGRNYFDYLTVRYANDGTQLWTARYDGPAHARDAAYAIAVDHQGNAYVTGTSRLRAYPDPPLVGCVTIKYGPDGDTVWTATYSGLQSVPCIGAAIAVDGSGNVYVTGTYNYDILTIKYVQSGGGVEERSVPSAQAALPALEARPSPFTARTAISLRVTAQGRAGVAVFDAVGRPVRTLLDGRLPAGVHVVVWDRADDDGQRVPAGVYTI
ncbi:hypothetical protein FJY69_09130, partial [candidate division WOR-3 bacterium]|nr:hypothetical protein [candidate division WOR-3 bacterium]